MMKALKSAVVLVLAATISASAGNSITTVTNVLQNINLQLTVYQQGATNSNGRSVSDQVSTYTAKNLITALESVTGHAPFGTGAQLVQSTIYSNVTVATGTGVYTTNFSTNLPLVTNEYLLVGGFTGGYAYYGAYGNLGVLTISNGVFTSGGVGNIATNLVIVVDNGTNISTNAFDTNAGFVTTFTPSTNGSGAVTNVAVLTETQVTPPSTSTYLTNVSSSIDILYGGAANALFPVTNYVSFSSANSPEIVVESGAGLDTTAPLAVSNLISQTGYSLSNLVINYYLPGTTTNLTLSLEGFVKQTLKVDVFSAARGTNKGVVEDIFGAGQNWNAIGSGYVGGAFTTNLTSVPIPGGYLNNASPIVVEGSVNVSFLKNLAQ